MKAVKKRPKKLKLNPRDLSLMTLILEGFEADYINALLASRERYRAAPELPGSEGQVEFYKRCLSAVQHMKARLPNALPFLAKHPDYAPKEEGSP